MDHRLHIGGAWDEIGKLQFDFMVCRGLEPYHKLLDYGCGSGRGAVHFVPYLDAGSYLGIDKDAAMLKAAYDEVSSYTDKNPLFITAEQLSDRSRVFDFAICQSVFTHCNPFVISTIISDIDSLLKDDGIIYATWFEGDGPGPITHQPGGRITYSGSDPYHQTRDFWDRQLWAASFQVTHIEQKEWPHPRGQRMMEIKRRV